MVFMLWFRQLHPLLTEWRVGSDRLQSGGADPGGITQEKSPNFKGEVPPTKYWRVEDPQSWEYEYI